MGYGIAQSLLRGGFHVWGKDINRVQVENFINDGGQAGAQDAGLDAVVSVVLNADQTEQVLFGDDGAIQRLSKGGVVVSCATVAPDFARKMEAKCAEHDILYLDAPISGGSVKAASGALSVMASGSKQAFTMAQPLLDAMAENIFALGDEAGIGSAMKAVNQMLAGVHIAVMAEAMTFGMTQGISPAKFLEVIPQCAGSSWMLENRAPHIVDGDYTAHSQINIWPKDLNIVLDAAKSANFSTPITATVLQQYMLAVAMGLGKEDDAAIAKTYARNGGLTLPAEET